MLRPTPCVSVVIPVYNSAATLRRAADSVLRQTMTDLELVIADDGSTDASAEIADQIAAADARVRILRMPHNRGKPAAMNAAFVEAGGDWLAVLDADDWYEPDRLAYLIGAAMACGVPLVADNQTFHDAVAQVAVRTAFPVAQGDQPLTQETFIRGADPYAAFDYGMLKPIVRRDFVNRHGIRYREEARLSEDFLWLTEFFGSGGSGLLLAKPLYNWTQSFGEITRQWTATGAGAWRYDYQSARHAHLAMAAELGTRHETALAHLLRRRARAMNILHHINEINRKRVLGAPVWSLLGSALRHPAIWPRLTRNAVRRASRRIDHAPSARGFLAAR